MLPASPMPLTIECPAAGAPRHPASRSRRTAGRSRRRTSGGQAGATPAARAPTAHPWHAAWLPLVPPAQAWLDAQTVSPAGAAMVEFLDGLDVKNRWLNDIHIAWFSGLPNHEDASYVRRSGRGRGPCMPPQASWACTPCPTHSPRCCPDAPPTCPGHSHTLLGVCSVRDGTPGRLPAASARALAGARRRQQRRQSRSLRP